ncbi:saccharopine dehydrogenase family protein [Nocardia bovistercoris]|uniref:Saccharopine dehydrogenase n=1 Tax=Nocardia bovistercoris TaxID=2785916 RepID=A0A931IGM4_9NOCA|nr:saccharopine dehydrogenase [Nocardia bovistercoris]MBH0780015.1 hypothetical protein [Nocardia bovistercoris]
MKVLVLGGYGAVGRHLVAALRGAGETVVTAGRDPARADTVVDLADPALTGYRAALRGTDIVVNTSGAENPELAAVAGISGCAFVDITATSGYIEKLRELRDPGPILVDVGLAPGLTDLLAVAVHAESLGPVDIAVLLGAGEKHGAAATEWSYGLLGKHFHDQGARIRNYTRPERFHLPGESSPRTLYRVDFADQHTLRRQLGVPVRTFFGLDSRPATVALAALTWIPGASKAPRGLSLPGTERWTVMARGRDGVGRWARGANQSRATATITAGAVPHAMKAAPGVHALQDLCTLDDLATPEIETGRIPA